MPESGLSIDLSALGQLLPMHLLIRQSGLIIGCGPTLAKFIGAPRTVADILADARSGSAGCVVQAINIAASDSDRLFLKLLQPPNITLRGHAVMMGGGEILVNLGFGIDLNKAVAHHDLTDSDFAPPELAMELLFLHEANRAVMGQLSNFNRQLDEARSAAEIQAHTDALTGLGNRRGLDLALAAAMRIKEPQPVSRDRDFSLMHVDLDGFKQVNDLMGHDAGDQTLCQVSSVLVSMTRGDDFVARVGGDEFVLILPGLLSHEALHQMASRIIYGIEAIPMPGNGNCRISASIGITRSIFDVDRTAAQMLKDADAALYWSKRSGRGRATIFETVTGRSQDSRA